MPFVLYFFCRVLQKAFSYNLYHSLNLLSLHGRDTLSLRKKEMEANSASKWCFLCIIFLWVLVKFEGRYDLVGLVKMGTSFCLCFFSVFFSGLPKLVLFYSPSLSNYKYMCLFLWVLAECLRGGMIWLDS